MVLRLARDAKLSRDSRRQKENRYDRVAKQRRSGF